MTKPKPRSGITWYADYRVRYDRGNPTEGTWEQRSYEGEGGWVPVAYADVPEAIWSAKFRHDGWKFYTLRLRGTKLNDRGTRTYFETEVAGNADPA